MSNEFDLAIARGYVTGALREAAVNNGLTADKLDVLCARLTRECPTAIAPRIRLTPAPSTPGHVLVDVSMADVGWSTSVDQETGHLVDAPQVNRQPVSRVGVGTIMLAPYIRDCEGSLTFQ